MNKSVSNLGDAAARAPPPPPDASAPPAVPAAAEGAAKKMTTRNSMIELSELDAIRDLGDAMRALEAPDDETGGGGEGNVADAAANGGGEDDDFLFFDPDNDNDTDADADDADGILQLEAERRSSDSALAEFSKKKKGVSGVGSVAALRKVDEESAPPPGGGEEEQFWSKMNASSSMMNLNELDVGGAEYEVKLQDLEQHEHEHLDLGGEYQVEIKDPDEDDDEEEEADDDKPLGVGRGPMPLRSSLKKSPSRASLASSTGGGGLGGDSSATGGIAMKRSESAVSFHELEIREYDITLGDNVGCMSGPPVQLDWEYRKDSVVVMDVEMYEASRRPRKSLENMIMPDNLRWLRLEQEGGYTPGEMRHVMDNLEKVRGGEDVGENYWFATSAAGSKSKGNKKKKPSLKRIKKLMAVDSARRRLKRLLK